MSVVYDEYGRPFIVSFLEHIYILETLVLTCFIVQLVREQEKKARLKGVDAQRANILAARTVANVLRTSLGPKGMDKVSEMNSKSKLEDKTNFWNRCS